MDGKSLNLTEDKLNKLKEIIPEAFTEGKVDWEKLKAALGDDVEFKDERYVLNWAGKSDAFKILQSPTTATLVPCKDESVNFDDTGNVFIEGENLEVLKVLQKSYFGKIKMIYIDPPYNTGNDTFIYPDKFSETRDEYLGRIGDKDEIGYMTREGLFRKNSKDNGHYHSNWLSMMYPRLFLARNLLRDDGVIFVSIDYNEEHNLRLMMNEIFGEENYKNTFYVSRVKKNIQETELVQRVNFGVNSILLYGKSEKALIIPPKIKQKKEDRWHGFDAPGIRSTMEYELYGQKPPAERHWMYGESKALEMIKEGTLRKNPKTGKPQYFLKASDYTLLDTNWLDMQESDSKWIKNGGKNMSLISRMLELVDKNIIVLDFFSGSCTTAHAVIDLNKQDGGNRKFICVQLPEKCDEKSEAFKAGYKTIAEIGKERIRSVIKKIKKEQKGKLDIDGAISKQDLGFKVFKLQESNFKIWRPKVENADELVKQLTFHIDSVDEKAKTENILYELLLKSGVPLTAKIESKDGYFLVGNGEEVKPQEVRPQEVRPQIALILEKVDAKIIKAVISVNPKKVITLDRLFKKNDQLRTNTALQMKDAGIEFKVV
ncbi:MAG: site-specific DNA-methyltransferase [Candidatus Anammoxibacter sp.]